MENNIKKIELHIVVGCADARDVSAAFYSALEEQKKLQSNPESEAIIRNGCLQ